MTDMEKSAFFWHIFWFTVHCKIVFLLLVEGFPLGSYSVHYLWMYCTEKHEHNIRNGRMSDYHLKQPVAIWYLMTFGISPFPNVLNALSWSNNIKLKKKCPASIYAHVKSTIQHDCCHWLPPSPSWWQIYVEQILKINKINKTQMDVRQMFESAMRLLKGCSVFDLMS